MTFHPDESIIISNTDSVILLTSLGVMLDRIPRIPALDCLHLQHGDSQGNPAHRGGDYASGCVPCDGLVFFCLSGYRLNVSDTEALSYVAVSVIGLLLTALYTKKHLKTIQKFTSVRETDHACRTISALGGQVKCTSLIDCSNVTVPFYCLRIYMACDCLCGDFVLTLFY